MKIKSGFLLKEVAGNYVVISAGNLDFDGLITLNETGVLLWKILSQGCEKKDLLDALLSEFDVSEEIARRDIDAFLEKLKLNKILEV